MRPTKDSSSERFEGHEGNYFFVHCQDKVRFQVYVRFNVLPRAGHEIGILHDFPHL